MDTIIYVRGNLAAMLVSDTLAKRRLDITYASDFVFHLDSVGWLHCVKNKHSMRQLSFGSFDAAMAYVKRTGDLQHDIDCVVRYTNPDILRSDLVNAGKQAFS